MTLKAIKPDYSGRCNAVRLKVVRLFALAIVHRTAHLSLGIERLPTRQRGGTRETELSGEQAATANAVVIKKYANRRLYNTATSTYVTLDDLAGIVKKGTDFVV